MISSPWKSEVSKIIFAAWKVFLSLLHLMIKTRPYLSLVRAFCHENALSFERPQAQCMLGSTLVLAKPSHLLLLPSTPVWQRGSCCFSRYGACLYLVSRCLCVCLRWPSRCWGKHPLAGTGTSGMMFHWLHCFWIMLSCIWCAPPNITGRHICALAQKSFLSL